jgi:acyl dehydratase
LSRTDYSEWLGRPLGPGDLRTITQSDVDEFCSLTGDDQWIHLDRERASASPFGSTLVPGLLLLSLLPQWITGLVRVTDDAPVLTVGYDEVRFLAPVSVPSTLRASVTLVEGETRGARLRTRWLSEVRRDDELVLRATAVLQW